MILNYIGTLLFMAGAWLVGMALLALCGFMPSKRRYVCYAAFPIGLAFFAIVADVVYFRVGTSVAGVRIAFGVCAALSLGILLWKHIKPQQLIGLVALLAVFTVMVIPGVYRGTKYYVHRGNIWDKYFYLAEVVYMSQHDMAYGHSGQLAAEEYPSDVLVSGLVWVDSDRPTVPLLCAVLCGRGWGDLFFQAYLFINMLWAGIFGAVLLALEMLTDGKKQRLVYVFLALSYLLGFFAQLQNDIDAWSQMASAAVLVVIVCFYLGILAGMAYENKNLQWKQYVFLAVFGIGSYLLYPESTLLHGGMLFIVSVVMYVASGWKIPFREIAKIASLPAAVLGGVWFAHEPTLRFSLHQLTSAGSARRQSWAGYFDAYWYGFHAWQDMEDTALQRAVSYIVSWSGMPILTPAYERCSKVQAELWLTVLMLLVLGIMILLGWVCVQTYRSLRRKEAAFRGGMWLFALVGAIGFLGMVADEKPWSAGKLLMYISPYLFFVFAEPLLHEPGLIPKKLVTGLGKKKMPQKKKRKSATVKVSVWNCTLVLVAVIFVGCQVFFAGMRIADILGNEACTGYCGNYPSDQYPSLKENYPYKFDAKAYVKESVVAVDIGKTWYQDYVKLALSYEGIPYYALTDTQFAKGSMKEIQNELREGDRVITEEETK